MPAPPSTGSWKQWSSVASSAHLFQAELAKGLHSVLPQRRRAWHSDAQRAARWQLRPLYAAPPHLLRVHASGRSTLFQTCYSNVFLRAHPSHTLRMCGGRHHPLVTSRASVNRQRQGDDPPRGLDQRVTGRSPAWRSPSSMPPHRTGKMHRRQCLHGGILDSDCLTVLSTCHTFQNSFALAWQTTFCFECVAV